MAQQNADTSGLKVAAVKHTDGYKVTALRLGSSIGYGLFRDMGTAPVSFKGIAIQPSIGLEFSGLRKWKTTIDAFSSVGIFEDAVEPAFNFGSFDICNTLRFKMQRSIAGIYKENYDSPVEFKKYGNIPDGIEKPYVWLSAGFGLANLLDVTVNPDYENSAAGISNFFGPEVSLRADIPLNSFFELDWSKYDKQLHAEIGLMPVAAVLRPGFAYIDNYTEAQPVASTLFNEFEWHIKPFAGLCTDIGFDIINFQHSRVSISYLWSFLSSGNSGAWRFDHASHYLHFDFVITLKQKRTGWTEITEE